MYSTYEEMKLLQTPKPSTQISAPPTYIYIEAGQVIIPERAEGGLINQSAG